MGIAQDRDANRVVNFSVKPQDQEIHVILDKLKAKSAKTGIPFSHLLIKTIKAGYNGPK
ncbi:MAG: hypothetical protein K0U41_03695 [Gammaproteobacteria bacterium]|nr:hypothetical protein [Gammaproteobacteria bacterium]